MVSRRVLAGIVAVAGATLVAELALRVSRFGLGPGVFGRWQQRASWDAIRTLEDGAPWPAPGGAARWALQPGSPSVEYRLDESGFRVAARGEPAAGCEVLAIGDSNVFGYGVPAEDAFPALVEADLRARGVAVAVRNAGICGSQVPQQRRWLAHLLARTSPDLVVLAVSPWSLRLDGPPEKPAGTTAGDRLWNVVNARTARMAAYSALVDRGRRRTFHFLADTIGWPPRSVVAWELDPQVEPADAFARRFAGVATELEAMVGLVRAAGAGVLLAYVPLDVQTSADRNRLYRGERLPYPSYGFVDRDYSRDVRYAEALARVAGPLHVEVTDATAALASAAEDSYLTDDYHVSAAGHRRIAEQMIPAVRRACDRVVQAAQTMDSHARARVRAEERQG